MSSPEYIPPMTGGTDLLAKKEAALGAFATLGSTISAAREAGVSRATVDSWLATDPGFAARKRELHRQTLSAVEARVLAEPYQMAARLAKKLVQRGREIADDIRKQNTLPPDGAA